MSGIKNYETQAEFTPEIKQAIQFDIRDNPGVRDILNYLVVKKGKNGQKEFIKLIEDDVKKQFTKDPGPVMFPWTRAAFKTYIVGGELHSMFGMGQWASLISAAVGALAQAGSTIYGAKLASSTELKIAKINIASQEQQAAEAAAVAQRQIDAQLALAKAQQPAAATGGGMMPVQMSSMLGGGSMWLMGAGILAAIGYIVYTKTRG